MKTSVIRRCVRLRGRARWGKRLKGGRPVGKGGHTETLHTLPAWRRTHRTLDYPARWIDRFKSMYEINSPRRSQPRDRGDPG